MKYQLVSGTIICLAIMVLTVRRVTDLKSPYFKLKNATQVKMDSFSLYGYRLRKYPENISYEKQRNAIMAAAIAMEDATVYRFIRSARASCNTCVLILLISNSSAQNPYYRQLAASYDVLYIIYEKYTSLPVFRALPKIPIHSHRWFFFDYYLRDIQKDGTTYDNIFFCDLNDSVFQSNIFARMNLLGDGLYAFLEDSNWTIGKNANINSHWIRSCYGEAMFQRLSNKPISCIGTVLASWEAALAYLKLLSFEIITNKTAACTGDINDQGFHNYIVHTNALKSVKLHIIPNETGFVGTVGFMTLVHRNEFGHILNAKNETYAVVHQLNRFNKLIQQMNREYQLLTDARINKTE
jgi:hypothetical protein